MKILEEKYKQVLEQQNEPEVTVDQDGIKRWYLNGKRHRTDGPAIESTDGSKMWFLNGKLHRTDGPAIEYPDGYKEWYLNGKKLTEDQFNDYIESLKEIEKGSKQAGANLDF